jgi:hypothetical protein|nr:MAG TPA: hypothetical protein [Crassvirales sp.]
MVRENKVYTAVGCFIRDLQDYTIKAYYKRSGLILQVNYGDTPYICMFYIANLRKEYNRFTSSLFSPLLQFPHLLYKVRIGINTYYLGSGMVLDVNYNPLFYAYHTYSIHQQKYDLNILIHKSLTDSSHILHLLFKAFCKNMAENGLVDFKVEDDVKEYPVDIHVHITDTISIGLLKSPFIADQEIIRDTICANISFLLG